MHATIRFPSKAARAVLAAALVLAGCAVEWQNRQPSQALKREAAPPGSVYAGWRVYQARCARCHGEAATGGNGPDLTVALRQMGPRRFVGLVLQRYDLNQLADDNAIEQALQRRDGPMQMPVWGSEPEVSAHVMDLYAYLAARSEGTLAPGRPPQR